MAMDVAFYSVKSQSGLVYLDDIVFFSIAVGQHLNNFEEYSLSRNDCVTLKHTNCSLFAETINYMCQFIKPGLLVMAQARMGEIQ